MYTELFWLLWKPQELLTVLASHLHLMYNPDETDVYKIAPKNENKSETFTCFSSFYWDGPNSFFQRGTDHCTTDGATRSLHIEEIRSTASSPAMKTNALFLCKQWQ
jgi:hypothetical protein